MTTSDNVPAPASEFNFVPDEIILYGVLLNGDKNGYKKDTAAEYSGFINLADSEPFAVPPGNALQGVLSLRLTLFRGDKPLDNTKAVIAAIYGYAFEGGCYRFDRPRVFLFERMGASQEDKDAQGCGFEGFNPPYKMWRIRSGTNLLELNTSAGAAQQLVLEANLPGRRAPNTYEGNMRLAHRGGRLNGGGSGA
ncbi:hypothetical protein [Microvirga massiliensis]|uniref:hypothetical protein n=1 Tax=Microvirga massiliensis TaxID=1033741 RepID=UPI00062B835E|nr:hypothetical protein [Microvirga massiliensis]